MARDELLHERLTESIIGAFYRVYNELGYGFLEKTYAKALIIELRYRGHEVQAETSIDVRYRGIHVTRHRIDCIVDRSVVVEVKAVETLPRLAFRQCTSYLKVSGIRVGLVLNFGDKPQLKRLVYDGPGFGTDTEIVFHRERKSSHTEKSDQI